ncbi:uncharacterized protein CC84DRAFT_1261846 [Paraphaeosphaeria sporulosa]|uniref:Jacalin-type lectin domain-containing protein n=1 Tax=Paraphaeosphaeria sporulosa TaxID=1460663 RepID=A0A177C670_9PLEO|nr:uncharacterized protein CC84DRAFT_1261846 [Paraphaeosphaeria sporulosa]OAG03254.1 hypothetical protein CC84DRAFT_1261846 [Paraphaeosphaeria sporulosa]
MIIPSSRLLCGAALALTTLFSTVDAADCSTGPFAHVWKIGDSKAGENTDNVEFCSSLWDVGIPVTGLDVWYDEGEGINALQIQYANGDRHGIFGVPGSSPQHQSIDWEYSKTFIDSFSLWGNGGGKKLGNIRMVLTDGREFDVGNRHDTRSKKTEFPIDVGAGVMLGFGGWGANDIKQGYALFLRSQIDHITMTDPVFDESPENLNAQQKGIELQIVDSYDHANDLNATINWSFETTASVHTSTSTTTSVTKTFGTSVSVNWEASILAFSVGGGVELSYGYSQTNEKVETKETEVSRTITYEAPIKPGKHVWCQATAKSGKADLGYTATINLWLKDGTSWSWKEHGVYSQQAWGDTSSQCQEKPFSNARRSVEWHA